MTTDHAGDATTSPLEDIPEPRALPLVGNAFDIDMADPIGSFVRMAEEYGPIFKLATPGGTRLFVSGPDIVDEVCDDARFDKKVTGGLSNLRKGPAGAGLFTSDTDDPLWARAHNILMTPFSLQSMRDYMPKMLDLADQLMDKWSRLNPGEEVDVAADMTRLTLDTIALCGFGYRFNSFYRDTPHPFVEAMVRVLGESQARMRQLPVQTRLRIRAVRRLEEDQAFMNDLVDRIIAERRAVLDDPGGASGDTTDLLGRMLTGVDKQTGQRLPDENIRAQCITFLIAGHESTSGLLSFALYYLLNHPDVLARARAEVDEVLGGTAAPTFEQVHQLTYVRQILDETLRLWPTAPGFTRQPYQDTVIGGYTIPAHTPILVVSQALHRHTEIWGPDAAEFNPDHTAPDRLTRIPPNAYKPFGTGARACIGRQFAIQEAVLVLGMLLQRFEFVDHLHYQLKIKMTLTIKPDDFHILVRPREGVRIERPAPAAGATGRPELAGAIGAAAPAAAPHVARHGTRLSVLFGSNLGTAESIATRLAQEGTERGFDVTLGALDDHVDDLPAGGAAVLSGSGTFTGIGSGYLASLPENGTVFTFVSSPSIAFRPPDNPHTPMIMIGAGTGLAPFRGFLQERAALRERGVPVGPSLLFFGCRNREVDVLYADELRDHEQRGLVRVENAFSRADDGPCRYVQEAMLDCADEVWGLLQQDAAVFVCGNASTIAPGVRSALTRIFSDRTGTGEADAQAWLAGLRTSDRFVEDIWGG